MQGVANIHTNLDLYINIIVTIYVNIQIQNTGYVYISDARKRNDKHTDVYTFMNSKSRAT